VGSTFALRLPEVVLRLTFAAVLVWTGSKYLKSRPPAPQVDAAQK
jgi:hypothetical protein